MRIWMIIALEVFDFLVCCRKVFYLMRWACHFFFITMHMSSTLMIVINILNCKTRMYVQRN